MYFNSIDFAIFLPIVFFLYWFVFRQNLKSQNVLILIASYIFYGWWDWRFLSLIFLSTVVDFWVGTRLKCESHKTKRKFLLWISILVNLGLLGFFKYYNFFLDNFLSAFSFMGKDIQANTLNIILPVGISFYTFQTLSYTIDVYKGKLEPTKDFVAFSAFVAFFPQLVAGPIERASNLLPQFFSQRHFQYSKAVDGMKQILWGLFKKIVIADNCAIVANEIFNHSEIYSGSTLIVGAVFFAFQIYGDFSGYSDIAIGTSRLFGFDLKQNFNFPYFSRDIAEFWRRWHISLSTWFRDYLYIPLGGSRSGSWETIRNVFIIFLVSGFWHGANWTFIIWGTCHALYFLPLILLNKHRNHLDIVAKESWLPNFKEVLNILLTFSLTTLAWIFFRAKNLDHALDFFSEIFSSSLFQNPIILPKTQVALIIVFLSIEWLGRRNKYALEKLFLNQKKIFKFIFYYFLVILIYLFGNFEDNIEFIYFQF